MMTYWSGMSTRSREIHILLNELSRVNHLQLLPSIVPSVRSKVAVAVI